MGLFGDYKAYGTGTAYGWVRVFAVEDLMAASQAGKLSWQDIVVVDQTAQTGWVSLGQYDFDPVLGSFIDVEDNSDFPVAEDQHIAIDAVRLTGLGFDPPITDPNPDDQDPTIDDEPDVEVKVSGDVEASCGCSTPGSRTPSGHWLLALGLVAAGAVRRRRR